MDRAPILAWLSRHTPADGDEAACVRQALDLLALPGDVFDKRCFLPGHLTCSALVVSPDEAALLLIRHRDFGFWMQPGGHLDPGDASLAAAARRELREETGQDEVETPAWAPALLDVAVHRVPAGLKRGEPAHLHVDLRLALRARSLDLRAASDARDAAWFPLDGLHAVDTDASVRQAAARILRRQGRG